ncbi:MAG: SdpI family protein [Propionibacteriaceae bacterium]|nr:SdpI family protein [Propionibacteriaceae bacterium]
MSDFDLRFLAGGECLIIVVMITALWLPSSLVAKRSLKANIWAGIRLPSTMRGQAAWEAAHKAALSYCRPTGAALLVIAVGVMALIVRWPLGTLIGEAVLLIVTIVWFILAIRAAIAAAKLAPDEVTGRS